MISKLRVLTHLSPEKSEWGYLEFRKGSPIIILESGEVVLSTTPDVYFDLEHQVIVDESGLSMIKPLKKRASILLNPILEAKFPYAPGFAHAEEPYYPPSTLGWLGRARFGVKDFSYVVQRRNDNGLWLTIVDENGVIQESHRIRNHEFPILKMKDDYHYNLEVMNTLLPENPEKIRQEILSILDSPPPDWNQLLKLTSGVDVQGLREGKNMNDSLDSVVPSIIETEAREEIKAFFAWLLKEKDFPDEDPLSFSHRTLATRYFNYLVFAHTICSLLAIQQPQYVKLLYDAIRTDKEKDQLFHDGIGGRGVWHLPIQRFISSVWTYVLSKTDRSIEIIKELNQKNQVITGLPVSKIQAKKSRTAFIDRLINKSTRICFRPPVS